MFDTLMRLVHWSSFVSCEVVLGLIYFTIKFIDLAKWVGNITVVNHLNAIQVNILVLLKRVFQITEPDTLSELIPLDVVKMTLLLKCFNILVDISIKLASEPN